MGKEPGMSTFGDGSFEHPLRSIRQIDAAFAWAGAEIDRLGTELDGALAKLAKCREALEKIMNCPDDELKGVIVRLPMHLELLARETLEQTK
jgi:hypothetical protein